MKLRAGVLVMVACLLLALAGCGTRPKELDSEEWGSYDVAMFSEERYPMALWLYDTNWFEGKTRAEILDALPNRFTGEALESDTLLYDLRYGDTFMERANIDYVPYAIAQLELRFEGDELVEAVLWERKDKDGEYTETKRWEA